MGEQSDDKDALPGVDLYAGFLLSELRLVLPEELAVRAAAHLLSVLGAGAVRIAGERDRQLKEEGFSVERDRNLYTTELARASQSYVAAALYAQATGQPLGLAPDSWPWADAQFKPSSDPERNLEKAGALIAAELDRLSGSSEQA